MNPVPDPAAPALAVEGLSKSFAGAAAVRGVSFAVQPGEVYALLGPNGAGKTTTLRMVAGLTPPDGGRVTVYGVPLQSDPARAKALMAYLPDEPLLYARLRPLEYLEYVAGLWGVPAAEAEPEAERLLRWLGLWERRGEMLEGYSRGMRQKVALAGALIHRPRLLSMDEPLTGLDAAAARQVKDALEEFTAAGGAVLLTTHILEVAERMARRIGIIAAGRLVAEGTLDALREQAGLPPAATLEDAFLALTARAGPPGSAP